MIEAVRRPRTQRIASAVLAVVPTALLLVLMHPAHKRAEIASPEPVVMYVRMAAPPTHTESPRVPTRRTNGSPRTLLPHAPIVVVPPDPIAWSIEVTPVNPPAAQVEAAPRSASAPLRLDTKILSAASSQSKSAIRRMAEVLSLIHI